jgi:tRNA C32,U32 (ribose-2'-O)-methylase TrmJ
MPAVILVSPFVAANVGSISRAMLNFGQNRFSHLFFYSSLLISSRPILTTYLEHLNR